jgi:hypothetical protein
MLLTQNCMLTVLGNVHHTNWQWILELLKCTVQHRSPIRATFLGDFRCHSAPSWLRFILLDYVRSGQCSLALLSSAQTVFCTFHLKTFSFKACPSVYWYVGYKFIQQNERTTDVQYLSVPTNFIALMEVKNKFPPHKFTHHTSVLHSGNSLLMTSNTELVDLHNTRLHYLYCRAKILKDNGKYKLTPVF